MSTSVQIAVQVSVWKQIDTLAAQIERPVTPYLFNAAEMSKMVIEEQMSRASMIRRLIPDNAQAEFNRA